MTANAVIFIIVNKFPKNGKIFTILKILFRAAKRARNSKCRAEPSFPRDTVTPSSNDRAKS